MPHEQLDNLVRIGHLKSERSSEREVDGLIHSGLARLHDAKDKWLSIESRFDLAYNAAHAMSLRHFADWDIGRRVGTLCSSASSIPYLSKMNSGASLNRHTGNANLADTRATLTSMPVC